jgi:hypothetical protein
MGRVTGGMTSTMVKQTSNNQQKTASWAVIVHLTVCSLAGTKILAIAGTKQPEKI